MATFTADFETTTDPLDCRVWSWGLYCLENNRFIWGKTIDEFFDYVFNELPNNTKILFHNLKFDGEFCLYYLFNNGFEWTSEKRLIDKEFNTLITDMGVFYGMNIKYKGREYVIQDSLKIIPLKVSEISEAFGIEQKKGEIDYEKPRPIGYEPTNDEVEYLQNDCEIVGKALNYFYSQGLNRMTQASNSLQDFKKIIGKKNFIDLFPDLSNIDSELRLSYKGGWTYANPKYINKVNKKGIVFDVNSLYPSVMMGTVHNTPLPYGLPIKFDGKYSFDPIYNIHISCFRCNFKLKDGYLPMLQIKKSRIFLDTEYLTSSNGEDVILYLTSVDIELFFKHYHVYNVEWLWGWKFKSTTKIFTDYINKWMDIKEKATIDGNVGLRTIAKLCLNSLYGKFGMSIKVRNKIPTFDGEKVIYKTIEDKDRKGLYIPIACFVTSYARKITIESAQQNYDRFLYADTDSLHLLGLDIPNDLKVDSVKLGYWKFEGKFWRAKYLRSKTYIEQLFIYPEEWEKLNDKKKKEWVYDRKNNIYTINTIACAGCPTHLHNKITFSNFKAGLVLDGKLSQKRVVGGVVLEKGEFTIDL